jgi:DNA-binding MarR family transcriptional regulator
MMTERTTFAESVRFGEQYGLYQAISHAGPITSGDLACLTGVPQAQVSRWLKIQVAGQYIVRGMDPARYQTWCEIPRS